MPLGQGVVSYGPPDAAIEALRSFPGNPGDHRYGATQGEPALVGLIEAKLAKDNGIEINGLSRVVVTAGGNQAFMNAILAITDPGDEVILQVPYYFNHEMAIGMAGARAVPVRTDDECQLDVPAIEAAITARTRAVVTISPNNPTGVVYPEASLRAVNDLCRARGIFHIHDEVYEYFTYAGVRSFSPASIKGAAAHTVSLFSMSKAFGMASWRIGYMVIPEVLWDAVDKIQDTVVICPPLVSQHVAAAALQVGRPYSNSHVERLNGIRMMMAEKLSQPGVPCDVPPALGAFYYFLRVHPSMDSLTMAERLIREHRVAVIPGAAFGASEGCHLRVSYGALDAGTAEEGINRLVNGVRELVKDR